MTFSQVHLQQRTDVPGPLASTGLVSMVVTVGVPAVMLSLVSALVFAIVLVADRKSTRLNSSHT